MPCSVTAAPIFLKLAEKVIFGARMETPLWVLCFSFAFKKKSSLTGAEHGCFQSLENAHFGANFYAVFHDDFTDLNENLQKRSSLVQEWRRRFGFFAFHSFSKKSPA